MATWNILCLTRHLPRRKREPQHVGEVPRNDFVYLSIQKTPLSRSSRPISEVEIGLCHEEMQLAI